MAALPPSTGSRRGSPEIQGPPQRHEKLCDNFHEGNDENPRPLPRTASAEGFRSSMLPSRNSQPMLRAGFHAYMDSDSVSPGSNPGPPARQSGLRGVNSWWGGIADVSGVRLTRPSLWSAISGISVLAGRVSGAGRRRIFGQADWGRPADHDGCRWCVSGNAAALLLEYALDRLLELAPLFNNDAGESGPAPALAADDRAILDAYAAKIAAAAKAQTIAPLGAQASSPGRSLDEDPSA
jgi:hypothetical protein